LLEKLYAGDSTYADADVEERHDSMDSEGAEGDNGEVGAELLARSRSARRQACEQYGPFDWLSQARQKSWKQSMMVESTEGEAFFVAASKDWKSVEFMYPKYAD